MELCELPEWQCGGAGYPMAADEVATKRSAVRALADARASSGELITLCSACHHVLKRVNGDMKSNEDIRGKVNRYLNLDEDYAGETTVPVSYTHLDVYKRQELARGDYAGIASALGISAAKSRACCELLRSLKPGVSNTAPEDAAQYVFPEILVERCV